MSVRSVWPNGVEPRTEFNPGSIGPSGTFAASKS